MAKRTHPKTRSLSGHLSFADDFTHPFFDRFIDRLLHQRGFSLSVHDRAFAPSRYFGTVSNTHTRTDTTDLSVHLFLSLFQSLADRLRNQRHSRPTLRITKKLKQNPIYLTASLTMSRALSTQVARHGQSPSVHPYTLRYRKVPKSITVYGSAPFLPARLSVPSPPAVRTPCAAPGGTLSACSSCRIVPRMALRKALHRRQLVHFKTSVQSCSARHTPLSAAHRDACSSARWKASPVLPTL